MKTNTEINAWEIQANEWYKEGLTNVKPKSWDRIDDIVTVSNVDLTDNEWSNLTNSYTTNDLVKVKIGEEEAIVDGTDLIIAIENALHASREAYNCNSGRRSNAKY